MKFLAKIFASRYIKEDWNDVTISNIWKPHKLWNGSGFIHSKWDGFKPEQLVGELWDVDYNLFFVGTDVDFIEECFIEDFETLLQDEFWWRWNDKTKPLTLVMEFVSETFHSESGEEYNYWIEVVREISQDDIEKL